MASQGSASALFLLGPARAGTSLLYKALCLHPHAGWISNYMRRVPSVPELAVLNRVAGRQRSRRRLAWFGADGDNAYVYGRPRSLEQRLFPMPTEGEPVFRHCGFPEYPWQPSAPPERQATLLRDTVRRTLRASGSRTYVSKRIAHNRRVPALFAALPEARFVMTVRDGRAVAASLDRVDWWPESIVPSYGGTPTQWAAEGRDPWQLCARNWVDDVSDLEAGLAAVPAAAVLRVSYEQFVAAPVPTLETIAAFAGLPPDPAWLAEIRRLGFPDNNEKWRTSLNPAAVATIEDVQRDDLLRLGYELTRGAA